MAANTKISYSVGLNVDTKQAKQDMHELMKSIGKISDQAVVSFDTRQIKEGIEAARELERHLGKAFDVKTGNLDLSKFSASIKQSNSSLEQLATKLHSFGPTGQASFNQLVNAINSAQVPLKRTSSMVDNLMINLKKTAQWQLSSTIIHGAQSQISQAISYVKHLNSSLINIATVSDLTSKQLADFAVQAQQMGKALATSTLDVTNAALIYFQQGDNVLQAMEKAAITIKAANASANSSAAEMSEYLTAIWNSYKVGSSELEQYVDVMAALGAKTASSMEEIATAMQKVAATANTVGVEFDQMSSIISTVSSVTRESAESIGTSYKTILARIGDLKLGNLVEDGTTVTLGQVSSQLKNIGINVLDAKGNMRDMGAVIEEIGFKWQSMNDAQKAAVAQTIAGKRQYTQLMALFENWDMYQQNMSISANADGSLNQMQDTWATGWEAASNRVRNSLEGVYSSLIDDSFVTGALNVIAEFISGIDSVIDKMGGLGGVVTLVGGLFATKLGGRTTEIIDALKTNLGLMTGSTKKQMIELNHQMELLAAKKKSSATTKAEEAHYSAMETKSAARASYLKNQDRLSLAQREEFNAKSARFDEISAQREQVERDKSSLNRQNNANKKKRESQFFDSALIYPDNTEEVGQARTAADLAKQEAEAARNTAIQAHQAVVEAQAAHDTVQQQLTDLVDKAKKAQETRDQKLAEAAANKDPGGQRGLEKQAEAAEAELVQLNAEIEAKKKELEQAEQKVKAAQENRQSKNTIMKDKEKAARNAKSKVKDIAKKNNVSQELRKQQEEAKKALKPVKVELDELIHLQESGASSGQISKAAKALLKKMEDSLFDSAKRENLGGQLENLINGKLNDINAVMDLDLNEEELQQELTRAKQALIDFQQSAAASGFEITIDADVTSLAQAQEQMASAQTQISTLTGQAASSSQAIGDLMESFGIEPADIQSIRDAGNSMGELEGRSQELDGSMQRLANDMAGAAIPTTTVLDAFTALSGGILTVVGAIQTLSGAWETMWDPDATPIEKVTAALTALATIVGVVSSVTQVARVISDAHTTSLAKKLVVSKGLTLEEAKQEVVKNKLIAAEALHQAIQEKGFLVALKDIAMKKLQAIANAGETASLWAKVAAKIAELALSGPKGWAILAAGIAITAAATAGIIAATKAIVAKTQAQEKLNAAIEDSTGVMQDNANVIEKLKGDLVSLASILDNTSLSYEEQLEKINEVTSAYGVQATMLDVLSGNYGRLAAEMTNAVAAEASITRATMESNLTNRTQLLSDKIEGNDGDWFGDNAFWGHGNNAFLKKWDNTKISSAEKDWLIDSNINFSQYGMKLNKKGQLESTRDLTAEDYMGLYDAMTAAGVQDQNFSSDSYMGKMLAQMEGEWDFDSLDRLEEQIADARQFEELLTQHADKFDMLNLEGRERSLEDMYGLLGDSMGLTDSEDISKWAEYLGQYEHWAPASQQLLAVEQQATEVASMNGVDQESVSKAMQEALFPGEDGRVIIDVETLIRVNPSDIVWNEDGTFDISEEARALAQAQVDKQKAIDTQAAIDQVSSTVDGKEVLTREDYSAITVTGLFEEGSAEFDQFMIASPAIRAMILKQKQIEAEQAELEALYAEVENATSLSEQYKTRYDEYLANLKDSLTGTSLVNDAEFKNLEGEELYRALMSRKSKIESELNYMKNFQDTEITDDTSEEDAAAYKEAALAAMSAEDAVKWRNKTAKEIYEGWSQAAEDGWDSGDLQADLDAIALVTAQGEALEAGISDTMARMTEGMNEIDAIEWWNETGKAISDATTAVEGFTNAIGQMGKMSSEELAKLQSIDPNALNNYKIMSSDEWDAYAYEQTMAYYDELLSLYDKDSIDYITTLQAKQAATDQYYETVKEKAKASAEYLTEQAEKEAKAIEEALSKLSGISFEQGLDSLGLDGIEELRQSLMEVYNDADLVDSMIRNIGKDKAGSKEAAIALADAKTALALKGHEALIEKQDAASSILSYSAEVESIQPPLYNDDGVLKMKTVDGEILTQIRGLPDNIFVNEKGELVKFDPQTGTYNIIGNAANSVFLTSDGKLVTVNPQTGTYNIVDDAKQAEFFNDNGTLKVRTGFGIYTVADVNTTDFFTDKGVLRDKNADGTYTITADNKTTFFDSKTGGLKADLNGQAKYTVKATSGNTEVFLEEGGVLALQDFTDGNANFTAKINDNAGDGKPGTLSVVNGVISISSVDANGTITAALKEGTYKGITANADGSISISGIDPNTAQGQAFLEVAAQEGLGIDITGEGENTVITLQGFTLPTVNPISVSAEAGEGVTGTGTEADPFKVNIDTSDLYKTIRISYIEENYDLLNDKLYKWGDRQSNILEGTGFSASDSRGSKRETRNSLEDIGDGYLSAAFDQAYMYYNGDFLKMYKEDVMGRDWARVGAADLANEVTSWYNLAYQNYLTQFNGDIEQANAAIETEIANMGENSGIQLLFDLMEAEMSLGHGGNIMNLFNGYTDINGRQVSAEEEVERMIDLWLNTFEGSLQNGTLESSAVFLIQGLVQGLQGNTDMLAKVAAMLGYTTIQEMNHALGIASPSKYTMEMGYWLIAGLSKGFQEAEFDPGNFGESVMNRLKDELKNVDMAEIWTDMGFGYKDMTEEEFKTAVANNTLRDDQKATVLKNWNSRNTTQYGSYDELVASGANISGYGDGVKSSMVTSRAEVLRQYGAQIEQNEAGQWVVRAFDAAGNDLGLIEGIAYDTAEQAEDAFIASEYAEKKLGDYLDGGFFTDDSLTETQKVIMESIIEEAVKAASNGQYSDVSDYLANNGSIQELIPYLEDSYTNYQTSLNNAVDLSWAKIKQTWKDTLADCQELDEEAAEQTYERWVTAWEAIGKARIAALTGEGGSLADQWSEDEQYEMAKRMQASGMDLEQIVSTQLSGSYNLDADYLKLGSYASSGRGQMHDLIGLNMGPFGMPTNTTLEEYKRNTRDYWTAWGNDSLQTSQFFSHTQDYEKAANMAYDDQGTLKSQEAFLTEWAASLGTTLDKLTAEQRQTALSYRETAATLVGGKAMTKGENGYKLNGTKEEIVELYVQGKTDLSDAQWSENYENAVAAGATSRIKYQTDYKAQMIDEADAEIKKLQGDQSIIRKAMEEGLEALSPEERMDYDTIMSEGGYTSLNQANLGLAAEMDSTATALARMRSAIENGYTVTDSGEWIKPKDITSETGEAVYTKEDAEKLEHGWQASEKDPSKYVMTQAFEGSDGKYYIVTSTASVDSLGTTDSEAFKEGTSDVTASSEYTHEATNYNYDLDATKYGFENKADWDDATEHIQNIAVANKELADSLATDEAAAREVAKEISRYNKSVEAITSSYKDWNKALQGNDIDAQRKAIQDLDKAYSDMLDLDYESLPRTFLESTENLELMKKAAEGSQAAYDQLQSKAAEALYTQIKGVTEVPEDIQNTIDEIAAIEGINVGDLITVEDTVDVNSLAYQLTSLYNNAYDAAIAGGATAAQAMEIANQMMNAVGFDAPEMEEKTITLTGDIPDGWTPQPNGTVTTVDADGNTTVVKGVKAIPKEGGTYEYQQTLLVPKGKGFSKSSERVGGSSSKPSGGGGGGGGGQPKTIDRKKPEDAKERYHVVNKQLDRLAEAMDKVDKIKSRTYGSNHLKNLEQEIKLLKDEIKLQDTYLEQAKQYLALDQSRVISLGAVLDANGNISNYDALIDSIVAKYNAFVDKYNAASAKEQENMEDEKTKMDEWYEEAMQWITQYEETLDIIGQKENEILELQNKISEATLEKIQYKVEYKVEIDESEKDYLDYLNGQYEEVLDKQDLLMDNYIRQGQIAEQQLNYYKEMRAELEAAYTAGELNQADYVEGLKTVEEGILENLEALQEVKDSLKELYENTLELADEAISKHTDKLENAAEAMQSYISILTLMGKQSMFGDLLKFYEKQYQYNLASIEAQSAYLDVLKEEEQYYLTRMNSAQGLTETERAQYEALQETLGEVQSNLLSQTEETLNALQEMYNATIENIIKDLEEAMVGADNSIAWLTEEYGFYTEEMDQYLSAQKELYEISKLNRTIDNSINSATTATSKKKLKALQDEINAKSELKELSEYELQMMNLKYELLMKEIALEEAQNAKSTVRLTRDSEGNMIYQYTADDEAVSKAQQEYEDVLQQMADTNWENEQNIYNQTLQLRQQTLDAIKEIAMDTTLTEEEKQRRINEIMDHYYVRAAYLQEQYGIVLENTTAVNEAIAEHYGVSVESITDRTRGTIAETIGAMINDTDNYRVEMENAYNLIVEAMNDYSNKVDEVANTAKIDYDSISTSVATYDEVVEDATTETANLTLALKQELLQLNDNTTAWDIYAEKLKTVTAEYEAMYAAIMQVIGVQGSVVGTSSNNSNTAGSDPGFSGEYSGDTPTNNDPAGDENPMSYPYGKASETTGTISTSKNSKGQAVKAIQYALNQLGYGNSGTSGHDGIFGSQTKAAVKAFQSAQGISATGKVEDTTRAKFRALKYLTGGLIDYTGPAWVDGSRSKPELILNATDTQKMFETIDSVRQLDQSTLSMMDEFINLATNSMLSNLFNIHAGSVANTRSADNLEQQVHITAEFPNVQNSNEIQDAFDNLINRAAQYINSKR